MRRKRKDSGAGAAESRRVHVVVKRK